MVIPVPFVYMAAAIYVCPFVPALNFADQVWARYEGSFSNSLKPVSMPGCLAPRVAWGHDFFADPEGGSSTIEGC
eukprot:1154334-Pelagomonas_calceolata.AAC.4